MSKVDPRYIPILMADDDEDDRLLAEDAIEESPLENPIYFVENGQQLLDYLRGKGKYADREAYPMPGLVLLDLNMPGMDGSTALAEIRNDPNLRHTPVVVLTTSNSHIDVLQTYKLGANSFITKPVEFDDLVMVLESLGRYWFHAVRIPDPVN